MLPKRKDELDQILEIPDKTERIAKLRKLAGELGVASKNIDVRGLDEQQLVLAVFDGFLAKEDRERKRRKRLALFSFCGIIALAFFLIFPRIFARYLRYYQVKQEKPKAYSGYDEDGELIEDEDGQPVLFHDMEGYYDEYYDDGTHHMSYLYKEGDVVEQREYDRDGNLIAHFVFDEEGNPTLVEGK